MKTTKAHFATFKKRCRAWKEFFGLKNWEVNFRHADTGADTCWSTCTFDIAATHAYITLGLEWNYDVTEQELDRTAFHEVCHILLGKLNVLGERRFIGRDDIDYEVHNVIRILENTVFKGQA